MSIVYYNPYSKCTKKKRKFVSIVLTTMPYRYYCIYAIRNEEGRTQIWKRAVFYDLPIAFNQLIDLLKRQPVLFLFHFIPLTQHERWMYFHALFLS